MTQETERTARGDHMAPAQQRNLGNPLDFIAEDHLREREICAVIDRLASAALPADAECEDVIAFLLHELPQHLADEEQDLFPLMRDRCRPEDEIEKVILRLQSDHEHAGRDTPKVAALLQDAIATGVNFSDDARAMLTDFADHSRRHLTVENAIILPIARVRLTRRDLETMRKHMLERRGLDRVIERDDAE